MEQTQRRYKFYCVIERGTREEFVVSINKYLADGYILVGGPFMNGSWCQAVAVEYTKPVEVNL